jgi:hypothetical protein
VHLPGPSPKKAVLFSLAFFESLDRSLNHSGVIG